MIPLAERYWLLPHIRDRDQKPEQPEAGLYPPTVPIPPIVKPPVSGADALRRRRVVRPTATPS